LAPAAPAPHSGPLASFYDALRELDTGRRKQHVRIVWLGDSHAQADFWTGGVRTALQARFGDGGPGFIHLGMDNYRHNGIDFDLQGSWRMRPKKPSSTEPWGDGAFGLGGILHAGYAGKRVAGITVKDEALASKKLRWDICYKPGSDRDKFELAIGDRKEMLAASKPDVGVIHHLSGETSANHHVSVHVKDGGPDFCGVVAETDPAEHPGVVLDNLGINGARYATALAWNDQAWSKEVQRRPPELFVFEYGGNEASDGVIKPDEYEKHAKELIARAKRAKGDASCLVLGPADRADRESQIPPIAEAMQRAASASGCMFWNTWAVMGGKGSLARWRDEKKAAPDGVHLVPKGYAELSALLVQDLLAGYRKE
jgi:lysophospholipase L1-like esterase